MVQLILKQIIELIVGGIKGIAEDIRRELSQLVEYIFTTTTRSGKKERK